ncbi:hypothetical protein DICVIV_03083 [Dictyocaulus viviparus]|uniref:Uncharacterized protein n=1 Tax=Dictyocaulus viviparus TaxID=29172 RepID=A0A0D8Y3K2_DICVI|nr:hypothetical protein DICVIV_03083 [Dictyocaulus viviparus]
MLDDEWIADIAEKITRVLPGGVNALVFIESPFGKPMGLIVDVVNRGPDFPLEWIAVVSSASAKISLNVSTRNETVTLLYRYKNHVVEELNGTI